MKDCCIFLHSKQCPVRQFLTKQAQEANKLRKIIPPQGDRELQKMMLPMIEQISDLFNRKLAQLHYYCDICRCHFAE